MLSLVRAETHRLFKRWQLLAAFLLIVGFIIQGLLDYRAGRYFSGEHYSAYIALLVALGSGPSSFWVGVLPLAACLIAGDSLAWDRRSGVIRFVLTRVSRREFIKQKIIAVSILTGLVTLAALFVSLLIAAAWFPLELPPWRVVNGVPTLVPYAGLPEDYINLFPRFLHSLFFTHPFVFLLLVMCTVTLSCITWANVAVLLSLWTTNIYVVLTGPWLLYVLATFIFSLPLVNRPNYSPLVLSGSFVKNGGGIFGGWVPLVWLVFSMLLGVTTHVLFLKKRGRDVLD